MLTSDFNNEIGALLRALGARTRQHPNLIHSDEQDALDHLKDAIIALVAVYLSMRDND